MEKNFDKDFTLDFIYIGTGRAASSWIYECLKEHPQICVPRKKEISPFNKENKELNEKLFSFLDNYGKTHTKGVFVPNFFVEKENVFLLKKYFPNIKIIACLREPIKRAYSHYWLDKSVGRTNKVFEDSLRQEPKYINLGKYYTNLKPFFDFFPRENILVLIYENIEKNPETFIREIYSFLGIDSSINSKFVNKGINVAVRKGVYSVFLNKIVLNTFKLGKLLKRLKVGIFLINLLKKMRIHSLFNFINKKNIKRSLNKTVKRDILPGIEKEDRQYLKEVYKNEVKKLENLIDKDLSKWGY